MTIIRANDFSGPTDTWARASRRSSVIGVDIVETDYAGACDAITAAAAARRALTVTALAVHGVMTGVLNRQHRQRLNSLDMVLPDGQPVRWALNLLYRAGLQDRVYGPTLMLRICERAQLLSLSIGLYGNRPEVLEELRANLLMRFPHLRVGCVMPSRFGRVSPDEQAEVAESITASGVDLLFVGLGCPRQEIWLYENRGRLDIPLIAVGAAFDFHAKRLAQAPSWMQNCSLEWLFRLWNEPRRLWRRYLLLNPAFVSLLAVQYLRQLCAPRRDIDESIPYEGYA